MIEKKMEEIQLPFDYAKKKYLRMRESGWAKVHELLMKEGPEVFKSTIDHLRKHTMFENSMIDPTVTEYFDYLQ